MTGAAAVSAVSAVVPTLGASPHLAACLEALRKDGGDELEIVVVAQGVRGAQDLAHRADRWLDLPEACGFTVATNAGIAASGGRWIATVNDDAVVEPGWLAALLTALEGDPRAAAAQGLNVQMDDPAVVDGRGLAWNRWWQAVQLGHGEAVEGTGSEQIDEGGQGREVFGVSATAAVYRRSALAEVGGFDERLGSWYEDVDLAVRLRAAGYRALHVPAARALHAGGTTGRRRPWRYGRLLYGNRWLVAARLLGRRFPAAVPRLLARDLLDLARHPTRTLSIEAGWLRALRHLPAWCHSGPPLVPPEELHRLAAP